VIDWLSNFGWIKRRKVRVVVKREIAQLQKHAIEIYEKYLETEDKVEKEALVLEYEEIAKQIEQHSIFLVITRNFD